MNLTINNCQYRNWYFFTEATIFNNGHLDIVAPSPKNNNPNMSASFWIMAKFLFMFCSWITSSSYLDVTFLLGGIYFFKTFPDNSSTFLNLVFCARLKGRPSEIIRSAITIVRRVSLEVINFWELPSILKISEPYEKLLEVRLDYKFDAEEKPEITYKFVSFDEVILLKLRWMVDLMAADDLFCRLVMGALIFSE